MVVLLGIYYLSPWLRWDRGIHAPDQAILIDFPGRRFYFFFIEIWPQEVYYITGLLILAALALFLFTALFGRVWCGYACPQTVWTDLFVTVERWIEGDRNARIRLDKAPWRLDKIRKRVIKHALWLLIAVMPPAVPGCSTLPTRRPWRASSLLRFEAPFLAYAFIGLFTASPPMCSPAWRASRSASICAPGRVFKARCSTRTRCSSPTGPGAASRAASTRRATAGTIGGDCVDCKQCVVVCPMGIDIRDGLQLECIHCALCVDACNGVMDKLGLPQGPDRL